MHVTFAVSFYLLSQLHTLSKKQQLTYYVITLLKTTHSLHGGSRRGRGGAQAPSLLKIFVCWRRLLKTNMGRSFCFPRLLPFFRLVFITDCLPNSTLHHRRSGLPGRRCSCLEQSATARHFCSFSSRLCISAENPLILCCLCRTVFECTVPVK